MYISMAADRGVSIALLLFFYDPYSNVKFNSFYTCIYVLL